MSDLDLDPSASPSPSPLPPHCDYSDWSPSFSIIPSIYLLAFVVGSLGNSLVLWAYLDRTDGKKASAGHESGTGGRCGAARYTVIIRTGWKNVSSSRVFCGLFPKQRRDNVTPQVYTVRQSYRLSSHLSSPSPPPPASLPRSAHSLTDSLIASLALADLCFLVTLPLWAVYTAMGYHWPFGQPLCQISSFLTALNMYASVFSLSMLSVERYWCLIGRRHSGHHTQQGCGGRALWIVGGVWALASVLALPGLLLRSVKEVDLDGGHGEDYDYWLPEPTQPEPTQPASPEHGFLLSCQMDYSMLIGADLDETERERAELWWAAALSLKSTAFGFLLPLVILLVCYCSLARLLSRHFGRGPRPDRRRQRRLLRVIISLVLAFFLCWLPLHVNKTVSMLSEFGLLPYSCTLDQVLLAAHPYVTCLAYLNSCLNPLLYAACDSTFRKRCRGALLRLWRMRLLGARGGTGGGDDEEGGEAKGGEERDERSSAYPTRTQEETAVRMEEEEEEEERRRRRGQRVGGREWQDAPAVRAVALKHSHFMEPQFGCGISHPTPTVTLREYKWNQMDP